MYGAVILSVVTSNYFRAQVLLLLQLVKIISTVSLMTFRDWWIKEEVQGRVRSSEIDRKGGEMK